jgi:hypothetical protein
MQDCWLYCNRDFGNILFSVYYKIKTVIFALCCVGIIHKADTITQTIHNVMSDDRHENRNP